MSLIEADEQLLSDKHSNVTLAIRLLHLARLTFFASFPIILHVNYQKYRFDIFSSNPHWGYYPSPLSYPLLFIVPAIVLIVFDLIIFQQMLKKKGNYEVPLLILFILQIVLLFVTPDFQFIYGWDIPESIPVLGKIVLILEVSLLGIFEILMGVKRELEENMLPQITK